MPGIAVRLARAVQELNISKSVWLALPRLRMVGLGSGTMVTVVAIVAAGMVFAALRLTAVLAGGRVMGGRLCRWLAGAPIGRRDRHADQPFNVA